MDVAIPVLLAAVADTIPPLATSVAVAVGTNAVGLAVAHPVDPRVLQATPFLAVL